MAGKIEIEIEIVSEQTASIAVRIYLDRYGTFHFGDDHYELKKINSLMPQSSVHGPLLIVINTIDAQEI